MAGKKMQKKGMLFFLILLQCPFLVFYSWTLMRKAGGWGNHTGKEPGTTH